MINGGSFEIGRMIKNFSSVFSGFDGQSHHLAQIGLELVTRLPLRL